MAYDLGDVAMVAVTFYDANGVPADPTTVELRVLRPDGTWVVYVYLVDLLLIRDAAGEYHRDLDMNVAGLWCCRWVATGVVQAAVQIKLWVDAACV